MPKKKPSPAPAAAAPADDGMQQLELPPAPGAPSVKEKMRQWAKDHPKEAAERLAKRTKNLEKRRALVTFSSLIDDEMVGTANEILGQLLTAEMPMVVGVGGGASQIEMVPDNRTRLEAVKVVAAYNEGTPTARMMVLRGDFKDLDAAQRDLLMGSSAVQEALMEVEEVAMDARRLGRCDQQAVRQTCKACRHLPTWPTFRNPRPDPPP